VMTAFKGPDLFLLWMQNSVVEEATALSSTLTLPNLPSEVINGIVDSTNKIEKTASGFVPFLHGEAKAPANNGISLTLNVTEVEAHAGRQSVIHCIRLMAFLASPKHDKYNVKLQSWQSREVCLCSRSRIGVLAPAISCSLAPDT